MPGYGQSSRSTSGPRFIFPVTVWKIKRLSLLDGSGNSIFRSNRPGRSKAGSSVSCRLVAMMTYAMSERASKQSREETHLDGRLLIESVHLIEQLKQDTLNFAIRPGLRVKSLRRDGIDLIDKDDTRRVLASESEDISNHSGTLAGSKAVASNNETNKQLTSPRYFCTNSEPTTRMKEADVALATALTSMVLPVPET